VYFKTLLISVVIFICAGSNTLQASVTTTPESTSILDFQSAVLTIAANPKDRRKNRQDDRGRQDDRDERRDCREEEGVAGKDKRDCKQDSRQGKDKDKDKDKDDNQA
jgi:hypothetical protein